MPGLDAMRLDEVCAMVKVKYQYSKVCVSLRPDQTDLKFCYDVLQDVSRSFAVVIIQLHEELRDAVCLFYLVLRGLDTIEDDMSIPVETKKETLPFFHQKLEDDNWCMSGVGKDRERELLEKFYCVSREYQKLKKGYQEVISDICERMANGMCHFLENDVVTTKDYELYCHYVAGLVGHGLTRLFAVSGLEKPNIADNLEVANSMGLFLQKTNIIRDYFEDIVEEPPRMFWPKEIWGDFADKLADFRSLATSPQNGHKAVECLNAMIADALKHLPECVEYMAALREPSVFLFCAIPQVMAIATLAELVNNRDTFLTKVKIRKGLACKIILHSNTLDRTLRQFLAHMDIIEGSLREEDPSYDLCKYRLKEGRKHIAAYLSDVEEDYSFARSFFVQYPALGGKILYNVVDGVAGMFRRE